MITPHFDPALELSPGEYQAEIGSIMKTDHTIVIFRLTEPAEDDKTNPQAGLGGRIARAWFDLDAENPTAKDEASARLSELLIAAGADDLDNAIGKVLWIRLARVVMRSDPSRYRIAAVEFLPLDRPAPEFVR